MPRIGIDCRFAHLNAGLGRYTREIVTAMVRLPSPVSWVLFVHDASAEWLQGLPPDTEIIEAPFSHYSLAEQARFPGVIKQSKIDLLFSPHFNVPVFSPMPFVVTIHDLILHRYPNSASLPRRLAYRFLMSRAVRRARAIIAVSVFTATELRLRYGSFLTPLNVIGEGIDARFSSRSSSEKEEVRANYRLPISYFLYVGNAKQHKNVQMLLDAYAALGSVETALVLVTGGKEADRLTLPKGVSILRDVRDDDLPALYSAARAFVSPSLYEGFGLPIAEAEACGCPVIAVKGSSIPEVASAHARLIDPTVSAFTEALRNPPTFAGVPALPSWEEAARKTLAILQSAL